MEVRPRLILPPGTGSRQPSDTMASQAGDVAMEASSSSTTQGSSVEHAAHAQRLMKRLEACDKVRAPAATEAIK